MTSLAEVLNCQYPEDLRGIETAQWGQGRTLADDELRDPTQLPRLAALDRLKLKVKRLAAGGTVLADSCHQALLSLEAVERQPHQADVGYSDNDVLAELLDAIDDRFFPVEKSFGEIKRRRAELEEEWKAVRQSTCELRRFSDAALLAMEGDSAEERRKGWSKEWTWERRAEFNWALGELEQDFGTRDLYHAECRAKVDEGEAHIRALKELGALCARVDSEFLSLVEDRDPRAYLHAVEAELDARRQLVGRAQADLLCLRRDRDAVADADQVHRACFARMSEVAEGRIPELRKQCAQMRDSLARLPTDLELALRRPKGELEDLERAREAEVERALIHSREFLADNDRRQSECRDAIAQLERQYADRQADLGRKILANEELQTKIAEDFQQQAEERQAKERVRAAAMQRVRGRIEEPMPGLTALILSTEVEQRYVREVTEPLYRGLTISLRSNLYDRITELSGIAEFVPAAVARCLGPLCGVYASLIHSLVGLAQDADEMADACQTHLEFCRETADPSGEQFGTAAALLLQRQAAAITEAHHQRDRLERCLQLWDGLVEQGPQACHGCDSPRSLITSVLPAGGGAEVLALTNTPEHRRLSLKAEYTAARKAAAIATSAVSVKSPRPSDERRKRRTRLKFPKDARVPLRGVHMQLPGAWRDPHAKLPESPVGDIRNAPLRLSPLPRASTTTPELPPIGSGSVRP